MKYIKSRVFIGCMCVVAAIAVCFGVAPLTSKLMDTRTEVVRVKSNIKAGKAIYASDLETVLVGSYNIPGGVIKDKNQVIGKYATTDIYQGDFLFDGKLTSSNSSAKSVFRNMGGYYAMSITVPSYAAGLSGKLENGDLISFIVVNGESTFIPDELKLVRVITTTTADGVDRDEIDGNIKPVTITVLVDDNQAKQLARYEGENSMHVILVDKDEAWNSDYFAEDFVHE